MRNLSFQFEVKILIITMTNVLNIYDVFSERIRSDLIVFTDLVAVPEIAMLRFEVWEKDRFNPDDFVGQACMPVKEILRGIRVVALRSRKGEEVSSKLLCQFKLEEKPSPAANEPTSPSAAPTPPVTESSAVANPPVNGFTQAATPPGPESSSVAIPSVNDSRKVATPPVSESTPMATPSVTESTQAPSPAVAESSSFATPPVTESTPVETEVF